MKIQPNVYKHAREKQFIYLFEKYVIYEWVNKLNQPSLKVCIVYTKMTKNKINKTKTHSELSKNVHRRNNTSLF